MSKLLRLYNSWDQYSWNDPEFKDEVRITMISLSLRIGSEISLSLFDMYEISSYNESRYNFHLPNS